MKTSDYSIFRLSSEPGYALIDDDPPGMLRPMDLCEGRSVTSSFPKGATCTLSRRHKGRKLADFFGNISAHLIVSEKAKAVLDGEEHLTWEWYPLDIIDLKGDLLSAQYKWAHLLGSFKCVDRAKSKYTPSAMDPTSIHTFQRMVLDPDRIPKEPSLFRLQEQPGTMIIRTDLVARLNAAGVTGFKLLKLDAPILL